jgi:hypothetical protein
MFHVKPGKALKSLARFHNPIARHLISRYKSKRIGCWFWNVVRESFLYSTSRLRAVLHSDL